MSSSCQRLVLRQAKLKQLTANAIAVLQQCRSGGTPEEEFVSAHIKLKQCMDAFERELSHYLTQSPEADVEEFSLDQFAAEDTLADLETARQINTKPTTNAPNAPRPTEANMETTARVPKLKLPSFSGDRLRWTEFWDRFKANIHERSMAEADKLSYLLGCLRGEAFDAVSGLPTTNENYMIAVDTLTERFGSNDAVIDAHYTELCNLKKAGEDSKSCRATLNEVEKHLRVLEKLGESSNGNHLRAMILRKFPDRVVHELHLIGIDNTMPNIRLNLCKIITAMEKSTMIIAEHSSPKLPEPLGSTTEALHVQNNGKQNLKRKGEAFNTEHQAKRFKRSCLFCNLTNHASADCRKVNTLEARMKKLAGRCLRCLRRNHATAACRRKISCFRCKGDHLKMLCPKPIPTGKPEPITASGKSICTLSNKNTYLQTAVAVLQNPQTKKSKQCRLLLDCGSQRSYITQHAANMLGLPILEDDFLLIYTFGASEPQGTSSPTTKVNVQTKRGVTRQLTVNIVPRITDRIPVASFEHEDVDTFGDDDTVGDAIHLLIGNDYYSMILRENRIHVKDALYLLDTDFGYVMSGNAAGQEVTDALSVVTYCQCHLPSCPYFTEPDLPLRNIDVKFLWSLESIGITDSPKATRQEEAVRHFNETVQHQDGRYLVKWPWIQYPPELPTNFGLALGRLRSNLKRLDSESLDEYNAILKEQLELGIIEVVNREPSEGLNHPLHYLPHHMIKQKGKKGRIVYDASAKLSGQKSLNENLYSGPSMLEDLTALLLKFRTKRFGILADVEKAFLQVALQDNDRDVTRFLWIKDITKGASEDNLLCLRFCRVPFGVISSPFLLTATIRHYISQTNKALLKSVADKCYIDNLVTGANSKQEAEELYRQTRSIFEQLSMNMRDWISNNQEFMESLPESCKAKQCDNVKVLGLNWDVHKDNLGLNLTESHFSTDPPVDTKRKALRALARVYDPCGFACALLLPMKLIFQDICEKKVKWDAELPTDVKLSIKKAMEGLRVIKDIQIPRYIGSDSSNTDLKYQLHCFTDASKNCYAAVIYLKVCDKKHSSVSFVMAKSHISQSKDKDDLKIPKLELLGFLIGSRLLKYVRNNLELEVDKQYLWSDSLVVLSWMKSSKLLPPFVANRVNEIKQTHPSTEMCYINTRLNPADIATRPKLFEEKKDLWFNGPEFLVKPESSWPKNRLYEAHQNLLSIGEVLGDSLGEVRQEHEHTCATDRVTEQLEPDRQINPPEGEVSHGSNTPMEYSDEVMELDTSFNQDKEVDDQREDSMAKTILEIKELQRIHFLEELQGKKTHLARNLDLFTDSDGLLRCRGRMGNTNWSYDMKYPILLPKNSDFTDRIIKRTHENNYHVGATHTLNIIRERYWIPQGKLQVMKVLRRCSQCIKHGGGPYPLPAAPALPPERVNYNQPFAYTGVDYFGPLFVSTPSGREKRWVALFTCLTVRAIHLEIVKDLSAEECLLALRRFAASRGIPQKMYSDNATCFKLVSEVVQQPFCIENHIQWRFIPQLAPWHGGFYERLVALVKHCLKRTLEKHLLNDNKLLTVLKEVESVLNSRPLTKVGTEVEHILRPADFLSLGKCLSMEPSTSEASVSGTTTKVDLIESWKRGLGILNEFKKMFISQYLTSLRERYNHAPKQPRVKSHRTPQVGDLVQIKSDVKNRNQWKVGKIDSLLEGRDGECRVARVKVNDTTLTRSIGHLYPLEVDDTSLEVEGPSEKATETADIDAADVVEPQLSHGQVEEVDIGIPDVVEPQVPDGEVAVEPQVSDGEADVEMVSPTNCPEPNDPPQEEQREEEDVRSRRGAAIRAREKILEWTRHLLALLH